MGLNTSAILNEIESHANKLGFFERVNKHEPKNAPGNGLTCAIWVNTIDPYAQQSGLAATSARVVYNVRVYSNMLQEPQDAIDPNLMDATDALMNAYSGDFSLASTVAMIDLLSMAGIPLSANAGYVNQSNRILRVMTITLPVIVNDAWEQVA
jgi:hypothetical protein